MQHKDSHPHDAKRRDVLALIGTTLISGPVLSQPLPSCILAPEQTEGPFFLDQRLQRADLRVDPASGNLMAGVPLILTLRVLAVGKNGCAALPNAVVDLWHCDAQGRYSGVEAGDARDTGQLFLRGYQTTDANGEVRFTTIYPGSYPGRAVHVHFKVRTAPRARAGEITSQLYFDEAVTQQVHADAAYRRRGPRTVRNDADGLFRHGGKQLLLKPVKDTQGYSAAFDIGMQVS